MATDDKTYGMGQYRYIGSDSCAQVKTLTASSPSVENSSYRDLIFTTENAFESGKDYYFKVSVPRDINYTMTFSVKLVNLSDYTAGKYITETYSGYQLLGTAIAQAIDTSGEGVIHVAYYQNYNSEECTLAEVFELNEGTKSELNRLYYYYDEVQDTTLFYLGTGAGTTIANKGYVQTTKVSYTTLSKQFSSDLGENEYATFEFVFSPGTDYPANFGGFDTIWLQMVRSEVDLNMSQTVSDGNSSQTVAGRYINPSKVNGKFNCYSLRNLVTDSDYGFGLPKTAGEKVSKFAINGNPGLRIAVNGEGMRIGPSGTFSFDAFDVASIGVMAYGYTYSSMFTIDYEYLRTSS